MADMSVGLTCPVCGGSISVGDGEKNIECEYCNSALHIDGDEGILIAAFKNKISEEQVLSAVKNWWKKGFKARNLKSKGKIIECYQIYIPFWKINARIAGWVCGYEERRRSNSNGHVYVEKIPMERMVLQDMTYSNIACDPGDLGIRKLRNFQGEPFLEDFTMLPTFEATTSKDDAMAAAKQYVISQGVSNAGVPNITFQKISAMLQKISMVYYPVWVIQYEFNERMYLATVDGVTGNILSGRAPGDALFQSLAVTGGCAAGGLISAISLPAMYYSGELGLLALIAGIFVTSVAYHFFRNGSERVEGDFESSNKKTSAKNVVDEVVDIGLMMKRMKI